MFIFTHQKVGYGLLPEVVEGLAEVDDEGVVSPEGGLDYGPVRNSAVTRHGVEIQISVQVIRGPLHLDDTERCQLNHLKKCFMISREARHFLHFFSGTSEFRFIYVYNDHPQLAFCPVGFNFLRRKLEVYS